MNELLAAVVIGVAAVIGAPVGMLIGHLAGRRLTRAHDHRRHPA